MEKNNYEFERFIAGFVAGEGWFSVVPQSNKKYFSTEFGINLNVKDKEVLILIKDYFGCGHIQIREDIVKFRVAKRKDLIQKIIPFFERNTMYCSNKQDSFDRWKIVIKLINNKKHLIKENLELIQKLAFDINGINSKGRNHKKRK